MLCTSVKIARLILASVLLLFSTCLSAQVVDSGPTGRQNVLPVEGAGLLMTPDTITPLETLINRLDGNWEFIETGKGYWIGYTEDMFSIAAHGDAAVPELVSLFKSAKTKNGKFGAIYTLHLIGINREIIARWNENFVNAKARAALLSLMQEKEYAHDVMRLLMRDPWQSDLPYLFNIIATEKDNDIIWPVINVLKRYYIPGLPVNNEVPDTIAELTILLKPEDKKAVKYADSMEEFNSKIKAILKLYEDTFPDQIKVDKKLYQEELSKFYARGIKDKLHLQDFLEDLGIRRDDVFSYCSIGAKLEYYCKGNVLYFCTISTAREMLNKWWQSLSEQQKTEICLVLI